MFDVTADVEAPDFSNFRLLEILIKRNDELECDAAFEIETLH